MRRTSSSGSMRWTRFSELKELLNEQISSTPLMLLESNSSVDADLERVTLAHRYLSSLRPPLLAGYQHCSEQNQQHMLLKLHVDEPPFGACCQAAHIKTICSTCWVGCVLTANAPLQGPNGIGPRPSLTGDLGLVDSSSSECDFGVQGCRVNRSPNITGQYSTHWMTQFIL